MDESDIIDAIHQQRNWVFLRIPDATALCHVAEGLRERS